MKKINLVLASLIFTCNTFGAVYIIGDSTACDYSSDRMPRMGWGQVLKNYFKTSEVHNAARSGRSTKSFKDEGHWQKVDSELKNGDYLFIQFGHNDQKKEDEKRFTTPGGTYDENLKFYVESAKKKGAIPVLMTSIHRRKFKDGKLVDTHGDYLKSVKKVAQDTKTPFIDMASKSEALFNSYGEEDSKKLFMILKAGESPNYPEGANDNTHLSETRANEIAKLVLEGIKENKLPLANDIKNF